MQAGQAILVLDNVQQSAALDAAQAQARTDKLNAERYEVDGMAGHAYAARAVEELRSLPNVTVMARTTVFGAYDGREFGLVERVADHLPVPLKRQPRQRLWRVVAKRAVLASGSYERPIAFGGNDRPGVMLASAVLLKYMKANY